MFWFEFCLISFLMLISLLPADIPAWLRCLRLHKYTPIFQGMDWRVVRLSDEELSNRGVSALGARRKMLKVFDSVRKKMSV